MIVSIQEPSPCFTSSERGVGSHEAKIWYSPEGFLWAVLRSGSLYFAGEARLHSGSLIWLVSVITTMQFFLDLLFFSKRKYF